MKRSGQATHPAASLLQNTIIHPYLQPSISRGNGDSGKRNWHADQILACLIGLTCQSCACVSVWIQQAFLALPLSPRSFLPAKAISIIAHLYLNLIATGISPSAEQRLSFREEERWEALFKAHEHNEKTQHQEKQTCQLSRLSAWCKAPLHAQHPQGRGCPMSPPSLLQLLWPTGAAFPFPTPHAIFLLCPLDSASGD
mmetsp:Transcript_9278/g.23561  ORF Transcript_9278/g.23561 Transcript_9278/m.23561 type:complete len:198 (-) Transcript_9278:247-840(-)